MRAEQLAARTAARGPRACKPSSRTVAREDDIERVTRELRLRYLEGLPALVRALADDVARASAALATDTLEAAHRKAHRIAGTAGCHGLDHVSACAAALEVALERARDAGVGPGDGGAELRDVCAPILASLDAEIARLGAPNGAPE